MDTFITISDKGRVTFNHQILFPQGTKWQNIFFYNYGKHRSYNRTYAIGFNLLYCEDSEEVAFEIIRHEFLVSPSMLKTKTQIKDETKKIDASLWMKIDQSINIEHYLKHINFRKYRPYGITRHTLKVRQFDNYIIAKIDPENTEIASISQFKKIQLKRSRNPNLEVLVTPDGRLALPKDFQTPQCNRVTIDFDREHKTLTLKLDINGVRAIKKDHTLNIRTIIAPFKIPQKMYLPFERTKNTITIKLTEADIIEEINSVRLIKRALGIFD